MDEKGQKICIGYIKTIIKNSGFQYKKAKIVLTSNDSDYTEKVRVIKNILSNLGSKEKFFSVDEYGPFAIKIYGGRSYTHITQPKTYPQLQKNKGSLIITAGLELSTNQITHFYSKHKNTYEMIKLLNILLKNFRNQKCIYLSWDAASWHISKKLYEEVEKLNKSSDNIPKVKLAPLPSCAQFLNVIESVFSGMAKAIIHNSNYSSIDKCKKSIDRYFGDRNYYYKMNPKKAGNKIWGKEIVIPTFKAYNNCKDLKFR